MKIPNVYGLLQYMYVSKRWVRQNLFTKGSEVMETNVTEALLRAVLELIAKCETLEELRESIKRIMKE